jgi:hypothetical protein
MQETWEGNMSMTKKDFITLANLIRTHNSNAEQPHNKEDGEHVFDTSQIITLANFCQQQNPNFDRERWLNYVADKCDPNGGKK